MRFSVTVASLVVMLGAGTASAAAQVTPEYFAPLAFLVGHCWTGQLPNGQGADTHCYEWMLGREFIRDRHAVTGAGDYRGESIYQWDPATKQVVYRYWNTDGGVSNGRIAVTGTALHAEDEEYRGKGGEALHFRSTITPVGATAYDVATDARVEQQWRPVRAVRYTRVDAATTRGQASSDRAVAQLRSTRGTWDVTTEFLRTDGSVARTAKGTYAFDWVVEDRVLRGESSIPELQTKAGILFFLDEAAGEMVMASVGRDGHLWVMSGPADGETRTTPDTRMPDGSTMRLRFTRFNATPDRFESRMEVSADGGATWQPGNHQVFVRTVPPAPPQERER